MMIRTDRRRFPVLFSAIAALALAGAVLKEKGKMNEFANILRTVPGKRTVQFWLVLFLFSLAIISGIAWPTVLQAETGSTLDLASLDVTDPMGTTIDLGTFDPAVLTYSANVASTVERVTVTARPASSSGVYVNLTPGDYGPDDNLWEVEGQEVRLNHGRNLILIGVYSHWVDEPLRVYTVEINRAGSATPGAENHISSSSLSTAPEGSTVPFLLTRSGDVSAALTVPVDVWSSDDTNLIYVVPHIDPATTLKRVEVEFPAGSASAIVRHETADDSLYTGGYHLGVTLIEGTGYRVSSFNGSGRFASTLVWDNDINKPNLELLSLTDQNGAGVAIGEFDPDLTSYSGSVGSEVTHVTVIQSTTESSRFRFASRVLPPDSQPNVPGHQVALQHGANLVSVILMARFHYDAVTSETYDVIVTRAGSPSGTPTPTVSVYGLSDAIEGYTMPFILARTGDTSRSLTVPVNVSETGGDMAPQASEGSSDVVFPAGSASARIEVPTVADQDWEEHSTVTVAVVAGTGYELSPESGSASSTVKDNDVPAVTAAFTVDTSQPQEGDVVTATVTVTTDGPKQPHSSLGNLDFSVELGSAQQADLHIPFGSNYRNFPAGHRITGSHSYGGGDDVRSASFFVNQQAMQPVASDGVITHYQYQFSVPILIVDDERAEADETFDISVEWDSYSMGIIRTMDRGVTSRTVTIQEHDDTPSAPDPVSYITVAIANSGSAGSTYTVSWHDTEECVGGRKYEVYLTSLRSSGWTRFSKLGETASTNTQLTVSKDNFPLSGQRNLRVYCGDMGRTVGEVPLPSATENSVERPVPGTYSSQPALTSLTVSPGTLGPAFSNYGFLYSVLDVPDSSSQVTMNATARDGYTISWDPSDDGDANTDGHQVDLAEGYNSIFVSADHDLGVNSFTYEVIVKRAGPTVQQEQENSPATGRPAISGTVQVGETLTADTSGIADADGLTNATFSYQWLSSRDTEIGGATSSTYTLQASDASKVVKVRVTFTDDAGNNETLTSAATAAVAAAPTPNSPATGAPTISGTAQVGETLTADTSGISDADGLTNVSFSYQWIRSDGSTDTNIAGQTTSKYTLVSADEGQTIKVRVSFTDDAGNQEMLTSAPTAAVAAPAQADSEDEPSELSYLTVVVTEDDSDPDNVVTTFTITWNDAEDCSASYNAYLDGVVGDPIHLGSAASEGEQIAASLTNVSAESIGFDAKLYCGMIGSGRLVDSLMIPEYSRSFDTVPISRAYLPKPGTYSTEPGLTVLTVSSGTLTPAFHSQTLNYTVPDVANANGRITLTTTTKANYYTVAFLPGSLYFYISSCSHGGQQTSVSYQDDTGNPLYPLTDADANTPGFQMELDEGENVFKIRVWPNCESGHVYKLTVTHAANAPANTPATGAPTISGTARVGETLTAATSGIADADGLTGATFSYQWLSSRDTEIQGATGAAYILVPGDAGKTIKVKVTFTDDEGNAETLTSAATGAVALRPNSPATGAPTIGGTAEVRETLTADTTGIADTDGLDNVSFSYQWLSSRDTAISGATAETYTLVSTDLGKIIKVKVAFTDEAGNSETLTSAGTAAVVASANSAGICDRTAQVRDNIIGLLNAQDLGSLGIKDCSEVTEEYLTRIRFLDLASSGVGGKLTSLKSGDFEGLSGMSELNLEDNSLSKLPEGVFDGLSRLERLTMQGNDLSSLPDGVFDDLTKLHTLGLYDNDLATLPDGIFDGLTKLRTLAISGNKLTALSGDVFTGLGGLASLVASNNKLTSLPDGVFSGMSKLQSVSLSGNPSAPFTLLAELERQGEDRVVVKVSEGAPFAMTVTLSAEGGTLSATTVVIGGGDTESAAVTVTPEGAGAVTVNVDSAAFPDGGTVQEGIQTGVGESLTLEADTSGICDRTAQVRGAILEKLDYVSDCADVTAVDLSGITGHLLVWSNEALTLKSGDFAGLDNVSRMGLSQNQISILPEDVFNGLDNLKVLLLYLNQLTSLPEDIFDGLGSLEELWLSHNQLSELPEDVFDGLGNLKTLYLEGNQLSALPEDVFDGLESLESLSLGRYGYGNQLSELPEDVFDGLGSLESLKLTDNQISALPEQVFDGLDSLEELYLFSNQISTLPEDVFDGLDSLEELYLGLNQISTLPEDVFDGLGSLENLFLNYNQFSELPEDVFDGLGSLESLELTGNQISVLPEEVFDSLISLRSLGLSGNQIGVLPDDVFDGLDSLTFLNLNFNQISVLPDDVFTGLDSLTQLIISNNQIAGLPEGVFDGLSQLYRLELNGNQLSELPEGVFDGLGSLLQLWLSNNPGAPFTFTAVLEQRGDNVIRVKVAHGAPVSMSVSLSAAGGNLSDDTATVAGGSLESDAITVTATGGGAVTVSVESADFVKFPPENINGIQTGLGSPLTLGEDSDTNNPATGTPTISGTAQVGEILTADTADITDADGLTGATFSYQWLSSKDTEIVGATSFTYTLLAADEGKAMKVRVSFTDDQGNGESLTSAATDAVNASPNSPATGAPTIGGTVQVGERLTAGKSEIADADGLTKVTFTYQWLADDTAIMGATDSTYTLAAADQGKAIKVEVSFTDDAGNDETLTSAATDAVDARPNSPATGAPTISGTVQVGQTLTADTSGIADTDGLDNVSFSYQWLSSRDTAISGATGLTYTLVSTDLGKTLKVRVSFTDDGGNEETLTSAASGAVLEEPVWGDGPPGAPRNLTATPGNKEVTLSWEPPADNGNAPATRYRIEWRIDGKDYKKGHWGTSGSTTYTKTDLANGVKYVFRVKAENGSGNSYGPYGPASEEVSATPTSGSAVDLGTPVLSNTKTLHHGMVQLDWQDIEDAGWYVVQYYHVKSGEWLDLPGAGVDISFHGSSAVVSNLHGLSWLRVRAVSCAGESEWSQIEELYGTRASDWEDVPVPEVAEGDQIDPCPVTLGTPVLSGPETLHHGMVRLDWEDIEDAGWYVVQYYHVKSGEWLDLPAAGVDIAFHGSSAVASDLHGLSWLRVRAVSCAGESEWSQIEELYGTRASDWEGVTVPEVAEGDEIEPCDEDVDTPDNSPATGAPAIGGTVQVGETLTANTSGVADEDGLSNAQYEYQWLADDTDISGATASTYTLVAADEGKAIQVKVSFTDDGGNSETLTSAGTDAVLASSQADSEDESSLRSYITVVVAEDTSDPDNPQTDFTITWSDTDTCSTGYNAYLNVEPGNRPGHETPGYQLDLGSSASDGALITKSLLGVQGSVEGFNVELYCGTYGSGRLVSTVEIPMAYGRPMPETYSSEPPLNALSVSHGTLTPAFNSHTFRYAVPDVANADTRITITAIPKTGYAIELLESSGGRVGKIIAEARRPGGPASGLSSDCGRSHSDALGQLIELTDADADTPGFQVDLYDGENHVYVSVYPIAYCILDTGYALAITRAEGSVSLPRPNRPAIGAPTISGAPLVGRTLNTHTSEIRDRDGLSNATFKYQWLADDADISEATNATYTLADADEGKAIKVEVSFTDDAGNGETLTSAATGAVDTRPNSPATGAPTITGTAQVGETLTANTSGVADADGLSNVQYEYQWLADDAEVAGATGSTYTLVADDMGKAISVSVSFTDDADNEETLTSGATEAAAARPNSLATGAPTISGTVQVGETLTANTSGIADADGLDDVSFTYQWLADDSDISGATNATYTLAAADEGKAVKVEVSFTDDADNEETLTSGATEAVAAAEPAEPPDKPRGLEATATHDSVTLTWDDPQDDSVTGYVILRRVRENDQGGEFSDLVADTGTAAATYTDDTVAASTTYTYRIKATNGAGTSERSRWVHIDIPAAPVPDKPRGLSATATHDSVTLTWDDPGDDSITGYVILRRHRYDDPKGHFDELVADTGTADTTYTDDTVAAGTSYTYRIKAINGAGPGERSRWFHIDTPAAP